MSIHRLLLAVCVCAASVWSQETRATIAGQVLDSSGSAIANASITVLNVETNVSTKVASNGSGAFEVPFLIQGAYEVSAEVAGFKNYKRSGITLVLGARVSLEIRMQVGDAASSVTAPVTSVTFSTVVIEGASLLPVMLTVTS
jgi:hypothetical protein